MSAKPKDGTQTNLVFYTTAELAEILKMHPQVITRKLQAGEIGGYKLGKDWRVSEEQLHAFLAKNSNQRAQDEADEKKKLLQLPTNPLKPKT